MTADNESSPADVRNEQPVVLQPPERGSGGELPHLILLHNLAESGKPLPVAKAGDALGKQPVEKIGFGRFIHN